MVMAEMEWKRDTFNNYSSCWIYTITSGYNCNSNKSIAYTNIYSHNSSFKCNKRVTGTQNTSASSSRRQPNRHQRVAQPGTKTSRRSRRAAIQDVPCINFEEDEGVTTHRVFDKFSSISKDYFDHGDPTEECQECHALLWRTKSLRGNPNGSKKAFSLLCFVSMVMSSSWVGNVFA